MAQRPTAYVTRKEKETEEETEVSELPELTPEQIRELSNLWPVRCYRCKKVIGNKQTQYESLINQGVHPGDAMTQLGMTRYCCRYNIMSPAVLPMGLQVEQKEPQEEPLMMQLRRDLAQLQVGPVKTRPMPGVLSAMQNANAPIVAMRREFKTGPGTVIVTRRDPIVLPARIDAPPLPMGPELIPPEFEEGEFTTSGMGAGPFPFTGIPQLPQLAVTLPPVPYGGMFAPLPRLPLVPLTNLP